MKYTSLFLLVVLVGCNQLLETKSDNSSSSVSTSIAFEHVIEDDDCISDQCTYVRVTFPKIDEFEKSSKFIERAVKKQLRDYVRESPSIASTEDLMALFMDDFHEFKEAFPESSAPWFLEITVKINFVSETFVSFELTANSYTGGAHENVTLSYFNIDQSGQNQSTYAIIKDREAFAKISEEWFRGQKSLDPEDDLNEAGYWFEDNKFALPENVGFTDGGVLLYYNAYEIGPYSMGPSRIVIPYAKVSDLLTIKL